MNIYQTFFSTYYDITKEYFLKYYDGEIELNESNYYEIVSRPANIDNELKDFAELNVPQHYKDFYNCSATLETLQIPHLPVTIASANISCFGTISSFLKDNEIVLKLGLIPFGIYEDEWLICFDLNDKKNMDNPAIKLFGLSLWDKPEEAVLPTIWFSSFDKFILCMTDFLRTKKSDNFQEIDPKNNFKTYS